MAHSYCNNFVHVVFSTKERKPLIPAERLEKLWAYFAGIARNHNLTLLAAGGTENHAHLLFALEATVPLAKAVQTFKANSSRWVREHGIDFAWQEGYGAFSVSASQAPKVKEYIRNQAKHHRRRSFEEEFVELLKRSGIPYDPKFVFG
ncbi:MAG: IS200/IS605 family transposase [Terriglobales bacterium]